MTQQEAAEQLYFWQYSNTGSFHNMLFSLIAKADAGNKHRLSEAFPEEVTAYIEWCSGPEENFYKKYNLGRAANDV